MSVYASRLRKLRRTLRTSSVDALLVTDFLNVTYLTGFSGDDSYLLITLDSELLITDKRYEEQLESECPDLRLVVRQPGQMMLPTVVKEISAHGVERLGIESASMTVSLRDKLAEGLGQQVSVAPLASAVEDLRIIKDKSEVDAIRHAIYIAERAFGVVRSGIRPGQTEFEVATELEYQVRQFGGTCLSFPALVGVGPRGALPHVQPGQRRIEESDFTLIDWGAKANHYVSDLTRMVVTGKITSKFRQLYDLVLEANLAGIAAIKPGAKCEDVDAAARQVIEKAGHGARFGHGLGHGIGLLVHESPRLSRNQPDAVLEPGMVVTVEPGVYFPGWGGIRIEDDVLVTRSGHEVLTRVPKNIDDCVLV
jgi:Xaa-Pro aminopeptidase